MSLIGAHVGLAPAGSLLAAYRADSCFVFSSARGALLAEGAYFTVSSPPRDGGLADLAARVGGSLRGAAAAGHEHPIVVGAVPFSSATDACLVIPRSVRHAPTLVPPGHHLRYKYLLGREEAVPHPESYVEAVREAITHLRSGRLAKVVLARSLRIPFDGRLTPLLAALARHDPAGYTFAVPLRDGRVLLGASPELLVSRRGRNVAANPLAGSAPRSADPAEDRSRARGLLESAKDRHEHALVVDAVAESLRPLCGTLTVPAEPVLTRTATMWHLSTTVTGELADPGVSSLTLAAALHPTPAVCGVPTEAARRLIAELEPFDRDFYTGVVGWENASGDGEWALTIRCAIADGSVISLFAGAGIVADSDPEAELAETTAKFGTALRALGLTHA
ncbi:isochorismate synthase [Streptosporangium becharense]|uniref:isochorismate synthase n=1 Tax=Streptosporangium becharense TaxID=1816182 RepID=A0A7W9IAT9_9ACTN|nr:isochorismate synthase [Streptosporangium becharense]MBB2910631.1 isochorismate synthase [Streptosporangium becharense]MBB5817327.1 isochorismate synthase [Streptosporangium becharense]